MSDTNPTLVWVSVFSCPGKDPILKPFYESIQHPTRPTIDELTAIVRNSFEAVGFSVNKSKMSPSLSHCQVTVSDQSDTCDLIVAIKTQPALQIGSLLFKLEEFEI